MLRLLSLGKPNKVIARDLGISEGTVKIHLAAIFRALNVRNRVEAVVASRTRLRAGPLIVEHRPEQLRRSLSRPLTSPSQDSRAGIASGHACHFRGPGHCRDDGVEHRSPDFVTCRCTPPRSLGVGDCVWPSPVSRLVRPCFARATVRAQVSTPLTFGILPIGGPSESLDAWRPMLDDMSEALHRPIRSISVSTYEGLAEAIAEERVDMAFVSGRLALDAVSHNRMQVIAQLTRGDGSHGYYAVLLVPQELADPQPRRSLRTTRPLALRARRIAVDVRLSGARNAAFRQPQASTRTPSSPVW